MRKFFVLCMAHKDSAIKTHLPVIARDPRHAVRVARGAGLIPYGVVAGK